MESNQTGTAPIQALAGYHRLDHLLNIKKYKSFPSVFEFTSSIGYNYY